MRSEIDIACHPFVMEVEDSEGIHYAYPYQLSYSTLMTRKQEYEPHILGIFQTFSFSVWITLISTLLLTILMNHFLLKWKHPFDNIALHVLAVLVRQSSILRISSAAENLLMYS